MNSLGTAAYVFGKYYSTPTTCSGELLIRFNLSNPGQTTPDWQRLKSTCFPRGIVFGPTEKIIIALHGGSSYTRLTLLDDSALPPNVAWIWTYFMTTANHEY